MTDLVIYKLGQKPQDPVAWGSLSGGALIEAGRVANVAALDVVAGRFAPETRKVAILPGEQVAMRAIPAPPKQLSKLMAAATFIFDDELAEAVDELHIIVAGAAERAAFAVSKSVLAAWLAAFDDAGLAITEMTVDYACLGGSVGCCVFAGDNGRVIAARGGAGFAAELSLAELAAPGFIGAASGATIIAYGAHDLVGRWATTPVERRSLAHEADLIALFGANMPPKGATANFLVGAFRRNTASAFKFAPYRRVAMLAAGLAAVAVVSQAVSGLRDGRMAASYEQSAREMHKAAFPAFAGDDIRTHSRRILADGVKAASFLEMSTRLTAGLEGRDGVAVDRIRYDGARGQYVLSIRSDSDAGIEAFRASLGEQGLVGTDSGGYRRAGEAWIGEMSASVR